MDSGDATVAMPTPTPPIKRAIVSDSAPAARPDQRADTK